MSERNCSLVVTVYRRYDLLTKYIEGLELYEPGLEVIVIDIDPIQALVLPQNYTVVQIPKSSYSKSINTGIGYTTKEYIIWGNDDIEVNGQFVESMISPIMENRKTITGIVKRNDYIEGCLVCMHRQVLDDIGNLDERFPGCYEDVDFSRRAVNAGYRLVKVDVPVRHIDLGQLDHEVGKSHALYKEKWQ